MPGSASPATALHDIVTGGIEGAAGVVATDALIENLMHGARGDGIRTRLAKTGKSIVGNFRAGNRAGLLKKLAIGAGVGAAATGVIGAGVNALSPKRKENFSMKTNDKIELRPLMIEFAGGYARTSGGVKKESGVGGHLERHAGAYLGTLVAPGLGTGVGWLIDRARRRHNIERTRLEKSLPAALALALTKGLALSALTPRMIELATDEENKRRYHPMAGTIGALAVPGIAQAAVGHGTMQTIIPGKLGWAGVGERQPVLPHDEPVLRHLRAEAQRGGYKIHEDPIGAPAFAWRHSPRPPKGEGLLNQIRGGFNKGVREKIASMTGSTDERGVAISNSIRSSLKPGVLAHEIGHQQQLRHLTGPLYHAGKMLPGGAALYSGLTSDEGHAKKAAIAGTLAAAPMLAAEIDASRRGSKLLKNAGMKGLRRLTPFVGVPSYAAVAAVPMATYKIKKAMGGYKPKEELETALAGLRTILFSERDRNDAGQFVANETGGADPNSMAAAYGPDKFSNRRNLMAAGSAALGGIAGNLATPSVKRAIKAGAMRLR